MRKTLQSLLLITIATTITVPLMGQSTEYPQYDNDELRTQIDVLGAAHNVAFAPSLSPEPITAFTAGTVAYSTNFGLKYVPPLVLPPAGVGVSPNTADNCSYVFTIPGAAQKTRQDFLAVLQDYEDDFEWSLLGRPDVYHWNTDVRLSAFRGDTLLGGTVTLPIGSHNIRWQGETLVTPILDFPPWYILLAKAVEASSRRIVLGLNTPVARRAVMQGVVELFLELSIEGATFGLDWFVLDGVPSPTTNPDGINNNAFQNVKVFDLTTPVFNVQVDQITVEATQVGGEYLRDHIGTLRDGFTVTDTCGVRPIVNYSGRSFMPVGEVTEVRWTARDNGPTNINGGFNSEHFIQRVFVQDTLPPIVLAPPARVVESNAPTALDIGYPAVFDLADVRPAVTSDAPNTFEPNTRTLVSWTAEDASGNTTTRNQWITLKTPGTNTTPIANSVAAAARTFESVTIELIGIDNDFLSGRFDQLNFAITDQPDHGFFVAPLFPYFIEDYRIENEFGLTKPELLDELDSRCAADPRNFEPDVDYVADPVYMDVDDDGVMYVIDSFRICQNSTGRIESQNRIAKFVTDADGVLQWDAQLATGNNQPDSLDIGANGNVYFQGTRVDASTGVARGCDADLNNCEVYRIAIDTSISNLDRTRPTAEPVSMTATADDFLILTDGRQSLAVYDLRNVENNFPAFVGTIAQAGELLVGGSPRKDLAMDSEGNLYLSDGEHDRVYKYAPSTIVRNEDGSVDFTPGELIGWNGRCEQNLTNERACDEIDQTSLGYACTDALCSVSTRSGNAPGQFDSPRGIAINTRDVLYVTDFENLRVQRFTPEGYFAGEAESECDGSCFVLGDFGRPEDVSANLDFFYVLDKERDLLHVFETTPITDIDDETQTPLQTARVTYQSDDGFQGTDTFGFSVNDGLATSAEATVSVNVTRNFRAPVANSGQRFEGQEDTETAITLRAFDPDAEDQPNLVYTIEEQPLNGTISGTGPEFTYTPDRDFFGTDIFQFRATDPAGLSSEIVTAEMVVAPVNDAPTISFGEMQDRYGAGFEIKMEAIIRDVDLTDRHVYGIDWGPGEPFRTGRALPPGQIAGPEEPTFIQAADGVAALIHEATYFNNGIKTLTVCVSDAEGVTALSSCDDPRVTARIQRNLVIDTTVLKAIAITDTAPTEQDALGNEYTAPIVDGEQFAAVFDLYNVEPNDTGASLDATDIEFSAMLGEGLEVGEDGILGTSGDAQGVSCATSRRTLDCTVARLPVAGRHRIVVRVRGDGTTSEDRDVAIVAMMTSAEIDHNE
ncbi:MAG: Ig-like domain-containing protein, partial [Pseudomonadota bacterium]